MNKLDDIKEEFAEMLEKHDWTYEYSDDNRAYLRGAHQRQQILDFMLKHSQYNQVLSEMYAQANPLNNNRTII